MPHALPKITLRPLQLQLNNSGAWKTLLRFDGNDAQAADKVRAAGQLMGEVNPELNLRIATAEALPAVLLRWSGACGWHEPGQRADSTATHRCLQCGALWRRNADRSWNLRSEFAAACCDNAPMGEQIAAIEAELQG